MLDDRALPLFPALGGVHFALQCMKAAIDARTFVLKLGKVCKTGPQLA